MVSVIAILMGLASLALLGSNQALGCLGLIVSSLVYVIGSRIHRERVEAQRHEELLEAMRQNRGE